MAQLRHFGIYELPDGEKYIAFYSGLGYYELFNARFGLTVPPRYRVDTMGEIFDEKGKATPYKKTDLTDTGSVFDTGPWP